MNNEKIKAVIAYVFGIVGGLIVLVMKSSEPKTKIHAAQSVTIFLFYTIIQYAYPFMIFTIPYFEYIITGVYIISIITGIVKVCKDSEPEIPIIGDLAKSIFKKQIEG